MSDLNWRIGDQVKAGSTITAWLIVFSVLFGVLGVGGSVFYFSVWEPYQISQHNVNVRQSIGYTQRANEQCIGDIKKFNDPDASPGQRAAAVDDCRVATAGVNPKQLDPAVSEFLTVNR